MTRYTAIGALSATVLAWNVMNVPTTNAAGLINEVSMAGITLSLENYAAKAVEEGTSVTAKAVAARAVAEEESTEVEEEFKLNLVYDRLGVAKVSNYLNIRKEPTFHETTGNFTCGIIFFLIVYC